MGLSSKQVSEDEGLDWVQTLSGAAELPKQPPTRRQQQPIRQQPEPALKCPRCGSSNTKFCYYNNYNKSQPRHFCKSCKRHWTKGGTLRNVPVGGVRKNKRPKTSNSPTRQSKFPMIGDDATRDDHNSMPGILYQAFVSTSSPLILQETTTPLPNATAGLISASSSSAPQNNIQNANEFQFSSLNPFEDSASWMNPTSYLSLSNAYDQDHYTRNLDSVDDSTVTTVDIPGTSSGPWPGLDTSGALDLPSYWNWNEIDVLTPSDPSVAWDGHDGNAEIKP